MGGFTTTVTLVPEVIDADALAFAAVRAAHLESPRQVADGLLAAADWPDARLRGVTAYEARMRAAEVLNDAGDRAGALEVLDGSPDTAGAAFIQRASKCLGGADLAGAQALVSQIRRWPVGDPYGISLIMALVMTAADAGYFDEALAWTDAAWTAAMDNRIGLDWLVMRAPQLLRILGDQVREMQLRRAAGDSTGDQPGDSRLTRPAGRESALVADSPPWPAVVEGRLVWWPEAEYQRLVDQLPDVRYVLGASWRQHTVKVESTLRAFRHLQPRSRVALSLVRAEFMGYVRFLKQTGSDPRLPEPLTAFTDMAAEHQKPVRWPPGRLGRCWCGSGFRYSRCCGVASGG